MLGDSVAAAVNLPLARAVKHGSDGDPPAWMPDAVLSSGIRFWTVSVEVCISHFWLRRIVTFSLVRWASPTTMAVPGIASELLQLRSAVPISDRGRVVSFCFARLTAGIGQFRYAFRIAQFHGWQPAFVCWQACCLPALQLLMAFHSWTHK